MPSTPNHSQSRQSAQRPACRVRQLRDAMGLSQVELAERAELSRQSLGAIEGGQVDPCVSTALRLAHVLRCKVEDLFAIEEQAVLIEAEAGWEVTENDRASRVHLARVGNRLVAHPVSLREGNACAADGVIRNHLGRSGRRLSVELFDAARGEIGASVALVGCAAAMGVLVERAAHEADIRATWIRASSAASVQALKAGWAHIAGIHFTDGKESMNEDAVRAELGGEATILVNLAVWEEGLVVPAGNPKGIGSPEDLLRDDLRLAVREPGAAARTLLEGLVRRAGGSPRMRLARGLRTRSHEETALAIALGSADVGVATRPAALALELGFVPQVEERFDLVIPARLAQERDVARLLAVLRGRAYRRELGAMGGHATDRTGQVVAELPKTRPAPR